MKERIRLEAQELWQMAYRYQQAGDFDIAIDFYRRSIEICPTAEAYTFLAWSYSCQERFEEAIEACKAAIELDPDFGNPYNDLGAYLIEKGELDEAIPYLEKATAAERYDAYHYPHCNLGRVYMLKGMLRKAREELTQALAIAPEYAPAEEMLARVERMLN